MSLTRLVFALPVVLAASAGVAASAATVVPVPPFTGIELHGGGHVVLKYGATQRVVILKGDPSITSITVKHGGSLVISPCEKVMFCPMHYELDVEVTTPSVPALDVHGGGDLEAASGFPHQAELSVAVHGGGDVNLRAVAIDSVSADVHGGGDLSVHVDKSLTAAVHGGGEITYWGHPQVTSDIHGGGEINSGS
jgi:hypothetical protein